jgi:hypothetical protein
MTWLMLLTLLAISPAFYSAAAGVDSVAEHRRAGRDRLPVPCWAWSGRVAFAHRVPLNFKAWRQQFITAQFRRVLPEISGLNRPLDAGTVGWEGETFAGRPD